MLQQTIGPLPVEDLSNDSDETPADTIANPATITPSHVAPQSAYKSSLLLPTLIAQRLGKRSLTLPMNLLSLKQTQHSISEATGQKGQAGSEAASRVQSLNSLNSNPSSLTLKGMIQNRQSIPVNDGHGRVASAQEGPARAVPEPEGERQGNTRSSNNLPRNFALPSKIISAGSEEDDQDPAQPTRTDDSSFPSRQEGLQYGSSKELEPKSSANLGRSGLVRNRLTLLHGTWANTLRFLHLRHDEPLSLLSPKAVSNAQPETGVAKGKEAISLRHFAHLDAEPLANPGPVELTENGGRNPRVVPSNETTTDYHNSYTESQASGAIPAVQLSIIATHYHTILQSPSLGMISRRLRLSGLTFPSLSVAAYHFASGGMRPAQARNLAPRTFSNAVESRNVRDLVSAHAEFESSQTRLAYQSMKENGIAQYLPRLDLPNLKKDSSAKASGIPFLVATGLSQVTLPGLSTTEVPNRLPSGLRPIQTGSKIDLPDLGVQDRSSLLEPEESDANDIEDLRLKISRIFEEESRRYFAGE